MKQGVIITVILILILIAIGGVLIFDIGRNGGDTEVKSFDDCVAAGYPVMESFPRQCAVPGGQSFTEIATSTAATTTAPVGPQPGTTATSTATSTLSNLIRVTSVKPNAQIQSPLKVTGTARGNWYFEASFPIKLVDANGKVLIQSPAQADGEWMTTEFVPFEATLTFQKPATKTGTLIIMNSNASGDPARDMKLEIPVTFAQ